jgi:hypothetical protein
LPRGAEQSDQAPDDGRRRNRNERTGRVVPERERAVDDW